MYVKGHNLNEYPYIYKIHNQSIFINHQKDLDQDPHHLLQVQAVFLP